MNQTSSPLSFQHLAAELRVFCGESSLAALAQELARQGCHRALVVCGRTVGATSAMGLLRQALGPLWVGQSVVVRPNSPVLAVAEAAQALQDANADAVIAVGGGSAAVTARAAAIVLAERRPAAELATKRLPGGAFESPRLKAPKLPQFVVPTTPSTAFVKAGSAIHDADTGARLALFDPKTRAKGLFVHPAFLATASADLVRTASLNTLSTVVEALESPRCDPISEAMLLHALRLLGRHLQEAQAEDLAARTQLVLAAVLCGRGTEQSGGGLASVLAHAIGHRVHAANGFVNAIVLPHTMRFNAPVSAAVAHRIADGLSGVASVESATAGAAEAAIAAVQALLAGLPIPRCLRELGLARADLAEIAEQAMTDWFISRNPRAIANVGEVEALLEAAW